MILLVAPNNSDGIVDYDKACQRNIEVVIDDETMKDDKILANFVRKGILALEQPQKPIINGKAIPTESTAGSKS